MSFAPTSQEAVHYLLGTIREQVHSSAAMDPVHGNNASKRVTGTDDEGYLLPFERGFNPYEARDFMERSTPACLAFVACYIVFVFVGPVFMRNRPQMELRLPLFLWNMGLTLFSVVAAYRTNVSYHNLARAERGVYGLVCENSFYFDPISGPWAFLFCMSKVVELGDTVFLVLRKRPVIFLHWYHHVSVLLVCWFGYLEFASTSMASASMNVVVHSVMYLYFALQALKIRAPTPVAMVITTIQMAQFLCGIWFNLAAMYYTRSGRRCHLSDRMMTGILFMFFTYFVLFGNFFYKSYVKKHRKQRADAAQQQLGHDKMAASTSNGVSSQREQNGKQQSKKMD